MCNIDLKRKKNMFTALSKCHGVVISPYMHARYLEPLCLALSTAIILSVLDLQLFCWLIRFFTVFCFTGMLAVPQTCFIWKSYKPH